MGLVRNVCVPLLVMCWLTSLVAQNRDGAEKPDLKELMRPRSLTAVRLEKEKIVLDGLLNEPAWQKAPVADEFIQQQPDEGRPATERTEVRVLYDDDAIYVGVYAYDSQPEKIQGYLTRRDVESPSDWIHIAFDSYADQRTAFEFTVNPAGVRLDALWSDDTNRDINWDAVWDVATRIVEDGWIAEFRIPLNQLRYANDSDKPWGFQVAREIRRLNELSMWRFFPRDANGMVSYFGTLEGIRNLKKPHHMQLLPYAVGFEETAPAEEGNPFRTGRRFRNRVGADFKYGITSNLTLDMTFNPDFGQVEADPSELNISEYETFFEEKRPFFIEGNNIFNYSVGIGDGDLSRESLFYSRRIGRAPQYYPDAPDGAFVDQPHETTLLGAAKLTGKTANGISLGLLEAVTAEEKAEIDLNGQRSYQTVEPRTNYLVARLQKDYNKGRTTIGGIFTNVYRDIRDEELNFLNRRAYAAGVDINHRWGEDKYFFTGKLVGSYVTGDKEAIQEVQLSSARYFQRPDADHVHYDPNRTSLGGLAGAFFGGKFAGGHWVYGFFNMFRTPGFEVNDIGYLRMADIILTGFWGGYREYQPGKIFRMYSLNVNFWHATNFGGEPREIGGNLNAYFQFLNYWSFNFSLNGDLGGVHTTLLRGGPSVKTSPKYNFFFGVNSDERKKVSGGFRMSYGSDVDQSERRLFFGPRLQLRPSGRFDMSLFLGIEPTMDELQYVEKESDSQGLHYVLGRIDRKTVFLVTRLNFTVTPDLSIQFYGQPFLTAGRYSRFKEIDQPHADRYADRFRPYAYTGSPDFNFKQFRSNLVVRWEYTPGSTLFLVWSQGRTDYEEMGDFALSRDFHRLFDQQSENVFLLKINRWFSL